MKAISLHQPWASAVALRLKQIETRSWLSRHLGPVAIHAAKKNTSDLEMTFILLCQHHPEIRNAFADAFNWGKRETLGMLFRRLPFGAIIATANIHCAGDIEFVNPDPVERALGDYTPGRHFMKLDKLVRLAQPIPFKGRQRWFEIPDSLITA